MQQPVFLEHMVTINPLVAMASRALQVCHGLEAPLRHKVLYFQLPPVAAIADLSSRCAGKELSPGTAIRMRVNSVAVVPRAPIQLAGKHLCCTAAIH